MADRTAYAFGSQEAAGRLNLGAATAEVRNKWNAYAGRKGIRTPVIGDVTHFLSLQYGLSMSNEDLGQIIGVTRRGGPLNMADALPRIADALLDEGVIVIERSV